MDIKELIEKIENEKDIEFTRKGKAICPNNKKLEEEINEHLPPEIIYKGREVVLIYLKAF